ncbi:MAG: polyprenyl synthetase family protein [Rhodospirillaceae bacterium]
MNALAVDYSTGQMASFKQHLKDTAESVNVTLDNLLALPVGGERRVVEAMRYAALDGGKRLRPFLVIEGASMYGVEHNYALQAAAALEMVHCYSLVHDDLPAMDDDGLRRGRPTVHKAYDEATAVLAGDGLLTRAFGILSNPGTHHSADVRSDLCYSLSKAAGSEGMVGGQMLDLLAQSERLDEDEIERLQSLKTGCLFSVAAEFGSILGQASEIERVSLRQYGLILGAAFQIADDLLDIESSYQEAGKLTGKDAARGKATFISLYGADRARNQAKCLVDQAVAVLESFGPKANKLRLAAFFAINRCG